MTNGVFAILKVKVQSTCIFDSKPRVLCKSARELPHFSNTTMTEAKKTIIIEDEPDAAPKITHAAHPLSRLGELHVKAGYVSTLLVG